MTTCRSCGQELLEQRVVRNKRVYWEVTVGGVLDRVLTPKDHDSLHGCTYKKDPSPFRSETYRCRACDRLAAIGVNPRLVQHLLNAARDESPDLDLAINEVEKTRERFYAVVRDVAEQLRLSGDTAERRAEMVALAAAIEQRLWVRLDWKRDPTHSDIHQLSWVDCV